MYGQGSFEIQVNKIGVYALNVDQETQTIKLKTPLSGVHIYKFEPDQNIWLSIQNTHNLEEMLMREFAEFSKGYLNL